MHGNEMMRLSVYHGADGGGEDDVNVIIETPRGSRIKYKLDEASGLFRISKVLPMGWRFPFPFGFVPSTRAEDGDPIDVLVLFDEPMACGVLLAARLLGVIEAEQRESGKTRRNDRLIAVPAVARECDHLRSLDDVGHELLNEVELFFKTYNAFLGREFHPRRRAPAERAKALIEEAHGRFADALAR
jgi:inorganic pyrophosphatase